VRRVGDPDKEEEFLKSRSPLFFVDRIKVPLLIGQGANDMRVTQTESDQIVAALRQAGPKAHLWEMVVTDGVLSGAWKFEPDLGTRHDVGRWHIAPDGQFCKTWHVLGLLGESGYSLDQDGKPFEFPRQDRFVRSESLMLCG
jgi:Prolyl oligopeptidase family